MRLRTAFSLVELSIVLVILGLLVGGILAGKALVRASELRAVSTEQARYVTAIHAFRDKYFMLPGDFSSATAVWGKNSTVCNLHTGTAATPGTCNGDANGMIEYINATRNEVFRSWHHLSLAGLIEGSYTGTDSSDATKTSQYSAELGENVPGSKLPNAVWYLYYSDTGTGNGTYYADMTGNVMMFGNDDINGHPINSILTPEESWNIDTKMDDGLPGTGNVLAVRRAWCTNSATPTDRTGNYLLTGSTPNCVLVWRNQF